MALVIDKIVEDSLNCKQERPASLESLVFSIDGYQVYGTALIPSGEKEQVYPCVILCHGFPGFASTFDIAQNLRRTGLVVISFSYRGNWGSQGNYTFSGAIDDAVRVAEWAHDKKNALKYHIDTDNIFFVGHSMGGFVSINATRRLPWIRGTAVMSPYDLPYWPQHGLAAPMRELIDSSLYVLHVESPEALYEDVEHCCRQKYGIWQAFEDIKDRNLYFIGASEDDVAPAKTMIDPLWTQLQNHETTAIQNYDTLPTGHSYDNVRLTTSRMIAQWIDKVMADE